MEVKLSQIINSLSMLREDLNIMKARQDQISGEVHNMKSELNIIKSGIQQRDHNRYCPPLSAMTYTSDGTCSSDLSSDKSSTL